MMASCLPQQEITLKLLHFSCRSVLLMLYIFSLHTGKILTNKITIHIHTYIHFCVHMHIYKYTCEYLPIVCIYLHMYLWHSNNAYSLYVVPLSPAVQKQLFIYGYPLSILWINLYLWISPGFVPTCAQESVLSPFVQHLPLFSSLICPRGRCYQKQGPDFSSESVITVDVLALQSLYLLVETLPDI